MQIDASVYTIIGRFAIPSFRYVNAITDRKTQSISSFDEKSDSQSRDFSVYRNSKTALQKFPINSE